MRDEEIKKTINEKIVDYCIGILGIDDLVDFVTGFNPKYICKLLKNPKNNNLVCVIEVIQDFYFYKENGKENNTIKRIVDYYKENLVNC